MRTIVYIPLLLSLLLLSCNEAPNYRIATSEQPSPEPSDWFYRQRAYPSGKIDKAAHINAIKARRSFLQEQTRSPENTWQYRGPDNIGGRITDIAIHPDDLNTIYAGAASGGLFKSSDRGESWTPVLDDAMYLSIGAVDVSRSHPSIVYVGTGEANAGGGSLAYDGYGVYKSIDAGNSWQHVGLEGVGSIGRLRIDPNNPDRAYVAAMGRLFANNTERGIYRTEDGGQSWEQVLYVSDSTGGVDLVIHPDHPDTVYATMWERIRRPGFRQYGGATSGIYRSYDGGDTWQEINNGLPNQDLGRLGIDISPSQPSLLYAVVIDPIGELIDVYKSFDGGDNWQVAGNAGANTPGFMWWFGRIFAHPTTPDKAYLASLDMYETTNGGPFWTKISHGVHVDQHALYISPDNPDFMVIGCDGGVYISENGGQNWEHKNTLPITQFYTCEIDESQPDRLYGGTQDNGTVRVITDQVDDWKKIWGGDGFVAQVDPLDNTYVYVESQYGNIRRSTNGGVGYQYAQSGIANGNRNWNTPYMMDPQIPSTLYLGGRKIYKSTNRAAFWTAISPDLVSSPSGSNLIYGTFTSISVSNFDSDIIYGGTDNGQLWLTKDGGDNWQAIDNGLPNRWLTTVQASPHDTATAYVTFSGYRHDDDTPHVFQTKDFGQSWFSISSNLPPIPVNDIIVDPDDPNHLYLANDAGVYVSYTAGYSWQPFGQGMPNIIVNDLDYHAPTQTLVAATYGRSMYSLVLPPVAVVPSTVSGTVRREDNSVLNDILIETESTIPLDAYTDAAGEYELTSFFSGEDYTIAPSKNDLPLNGISTLDLILINQHILGINYLDSPYKLIAADVNNTGSISTLDMIKIRKLILSVDLDFGSLNSWRFIPADHTFANPSAPWEGGFPETIEIVSLPAVGLSDQDFIAIKMGDVNLDAEL
jgi:photosystem II stability/assembly factor-like uncharacterized protein